MLRMLNPETVAPPFKNRYSHAVEVRSGLRLLCTAGQVGQHPDGSMADGFRGQVLQTYANLDEILKASDMTWQHVVKMQTFISDPTADIDILAQARAPRLGDHQPASTVLFVPRLVRLEWLVEIDLIAAD